MIKSRTLITLLLFSFISVAVSLVTPASAKAGTAITVCTDSNFWYPFTYVKQDTKQASGLHIDIITKALKEAGYEPIYKPMPWKQCLKEAKIGLVDAIATVSYKEDRSNFLDFPKDAATQEPDAKSKERVTQVEYVVVTPALDARGNRDTYSYQGDIKTIPNPVRIPAGYSIVDTLELAGLKVEENPSSIVNFKKLVKEKKGSVIDLNDVTKHLNTQAEFSGKLKVSDKPIFSKSYFLAFTKKGNVKEDSQKKIWAEIAKVREDSTQMGQFLEKY